MSTINQIKNQEQFMELAKNSNDYHVIKFYADWCGPCKMMIPIFESLAEDESCKNLKFVEINRDENRDWILPTFDIPTIPRFFLVKFNADGKFDESNIIIKLGGSQSKADFLEKLADYLELKSEQEQETADHSKKKVAIIGSGPSGLTAGIYTSRAQLDTTIYLGLQPGGQLTTTTELENFPGAWDKETKKGMMGPDLMTLVQQQAEHFGAKTILAEVKKLEVRYEDNKPKFDLEVNGKTETFDAVIIATGASARYLGLEDEKEFVGKGYHSCATCDGFFYRGKQVAIVGGGDSAMEEANFLTKFAEKVYVIHRRDEFRASKIMQKRVLENPKVEVLWNKVVVKMHPNTKTNTLEKLTLEDTTNNQQTELKVDGLFVAVGHIPNSNFVGDLLEKDNAGYLIPQSRVAPENRVSKYPMATKIPGVFVAGDIEDTRYRQAITAAGDGCRAAMDTEKWLEEMYQ